MSISGEANFANLHRAVAPGGLRGSYETENARTGPEMEAAPPSAAANGMAQGERGNVESRVGKEECGLASFENPEARRWGTLENDDTLKRCWIDLATAKTIHAG